MSTYLENCEELVQMLYASEGYAIFGEGGNPVQIHECFTAMTDGDLTALNGFLEMDPVQAIAVLQRLCESDNAKDIASIVSIDQALSKNWGSLAIALDSRGEVEQFYNFVDALRDGKQRVGYSDSAPDLTLG